MPEAITLIHQLQQWARRTPDAPALHERRDDRWVSTTWREYESRSRAVACSLLAAGIQAGDTVALLMPNRPEFLYSQMGILSAGGVPVPVYTSSTADQAAYIISHAGARIVIVDGSGPHALLKAKQASLTSVEKIVRIDSILETEDAWTITWDEFLAAGHGTEDARLDQCIAAVEGEALALLCYTSGTTGFPKGVMLTHTNMLYMSRVACERYGLANERMLSYLPLSHISEQLFTNLILLHAGGQAFLCDDPQRLRDLLPEVRPTIFAGLPRVWEKLQAGVEAAVDSAPPWREAMVRWAMRVEREAFEQGSDAVGSTLTRKLADLVLRRIRHVLGFDCISYAFSGGAPISRATLELFASLGMPLHQGYGMTETSGLLTTNPPAQADYETVGTTFHGVEIRIANDGEILARGPNLVRGYYADETQTGELWQDGWLHTGDVGEMRPDGRLRITDRKKELIKTSGGKTIAPQPIELSLKSIRGVSQAVLIGDRRHYITALLTLDPENAPLVAAELGISDGASLKALAQHTRIRDYLEESIAQEVNANLARHETIKRFSVLASELSLSDGELTPTLKLRRKAIHARYAAQIDALYEQ